MEEWKEYKYTELCSLIGGGTPKTSETSYWGGDIPWLSVKDFGTDRKYVYTTEKTITKEGLENSSTKLLQKDDIIISARGTIGAMAIIVYPMAFNQSCFGIRGNKLVDKDFLYYLTKTKIAELQKNSHGSVFETITRDTFAKLNCIIPPIKEQKNISAILKSLDDKIEVNRRINENLEQQAQALFKSWFVDFEPFKDGEFVESEMGMIPKGWRVKETQDVFVINIGKTPPRKESEWFTESNEDNVWVSIADMGNCGVFISDSSEYLTNEAIKRFNVVMVEKDTVLLSFKLTVGRVAIADTRLTTNEAIARFILPDKCYREYLYLYLKQYKYENLGSTSSIATAVNSKTIKGMKLIVPSTDIIKSFSNNTRPLFEQIRSLLQESRRLTEMRDALLPKLMSGELKVNEV